MNKKKDASPEGKEAKEKKQHSRNSGSWITFGLGLYFIILTVCFLLMLIRIWTISDSEKLLIDLFGFTKICIGSELRLVFIAAFMGALGSLVHAMTSFATYIGNRQFIKSWILWFILRPFIGMPLALVFYFVIRGGFFALSTDAEAVSTFGIAGLAGLVGMFSKQAIDKLREVFEDFFKTTRPDERIDKLKDNSE